MNVDNTKTANKVESLENELLTARHSALNEFSGIEHRLEMVTSVDGVDYINDSKATDVNSTWYSLDCIDSPLVWIVGVSDIETDYSVFEEFISKNVKAVICLGENKEGVLDCLANKVDCYAEASSIQDAVTKAKSLAFEGDVVLLSPACSSFHLYQNYRDRGEQFRKAVNDL